jgi:hypothetical protein
MRHSEHSHETLIMIIFLLKDSYISFFQVENKQYLSTDVFISISLERKQRT